VAAQLATWLAAQLRLGGRILAAWAKSRARR
jgi:hypothetical protein